MRWDFSVISSNVAPLLWALLVTIRVTVASIALGTVLGVVLATGRFVDNTVIRIVSRGVIDTFLALPVLVLLVWIYYCLPLVSPALIISAEMSAIVGLGLSLSAFVAQIVVAGLRIVPLGQLEVAYCVGLTKFQAVRYILMPQATRYMWAPLLGQYITCYKMSTLASIVTVPEILQTGNTIIAQTYRPLEIYSAIAVLFLITLSPVNYLASKLDRLYMIGGTVRF